jgi:hypothetical protein
MSSAIINWSIAAVAALAIAAACNLDTEDHSFERRQADQIAHDRAVAEALEESRNADLRACQALHGPNVAVMLLPDGRPVCTDKRGRRIRHQIVVLQEVRP